MRNLEAIFIGTSAGGVAALQSIFAIIADTLSVPIIVVQHLPADSTISPQLVFGGNLRLKMVEAIDKMPIESGNIYFAPPGYHLLIEADHTLALSQDELVHFSRPSIDVMFESAAIAYGARGCGILLTGANSDGASGLKAIQDSGGFVMVQDPSQADASAMPKSALDIMTPNFVGSLADIAGKILNLQQSRGGND